MRILRVLGLMAAAALAGADRADGLRLKPGPHLFVDDFLVEKSSGVERKVVPPRRFRKEPLVTSAPEHQNWQPWLTVLHDPRAPAKGRFRMWYNADVVDDPADEAFATKLASLESADGVHWPGPYRRHETVDPILFGASVVDDGPDHPRPAERYKIIYFSAAPPPGPRVAFSPDGATWAKQRGGESVLPVERIDDSWYASYDPIRRRYFLVAKLHRPYTWTNAEGRKITRSIRRYALSLSADFKTWTEPRILFSPDGKDPGVTEWYAVAGFQVRGDLILAFLQVLRDDLSPTGAPPEAVACNMGNPGSGIGTTVLAWTRDGETWHRDRHTDPFFEPDPQAGAWDHAMSWISSSVPVGDEVFLYYAGYRWGHKYRRSVDRQIGLVRIARDRYVARRAGPEGGRITTPTVILDGNALTLNADASRGEVRVQVTDGSGWPLPGLAFADCRPIAVDSLDAPVRWTVGSLAAVRGREVRLEFELKDASLFAFGLADGP